MLLGDESISDEGRYAPNDAGDTPDAVCYGGIT